MDNVTFDKKQLGIELGLGVNDAKYSITVDKPLVCPLCDMAQDGKFVDKQGLWMDNNKTSVILVRYQCARCRQHYFIVYEIDHMKKTAKFGTFYPFRKAILIDEILEGLSPRFIDMFNQALSSEDNGNIELAAVGYRSALEFLIKDYAIKELKKPQEEVVKKKLEKAISTYLDPESVKSADVVRILGNDFTHYERKYPDHDFKILKEYTKIFIDQVRVKLRIAHPPVVRKDHSQQEDFPLSPSTE